MSLVIHGTTGINATDISVGGREIYESGANSNGEYVRFYDGTQICWRNVAPSDLPERTTGGLGNHWLIDYRGPWNTSVVYATSRGDLDVFDFPASFLHTPAVFCGVNSTSSAGWDSFPTVGVNVVPQWRFAVRAGFVSSGHNAINYVIGAIGRWR